MNIHTEGNTSPAIIRHEEVEVLGHVVLVAVTEEGNFVSPRHICEAIGVAWTGQRKKITEDEDLSATVKEMFTVGSDGKNRKHVMLPFELMSGWLFSIKPGKVKESVRPALKKFRTQAYAVLHAWLK